MESNPKIYELIKNHGQNRRGFSGWKLIGEGVETNVQRDLLKQDRLLSAAGLPLFEAHSGR